MTCAVMSRKLVMLRFDAVGGVAGRGVDLVHGGDEFRHAQHQRVFQRAHVLVRAGQHFLQHDVGFAQPLEQSGGVGAQHVVGFQHLADGGGRGLLRDGRSPSARSRCSSLSVRVTVLVAVSPAVLIMREISLLLSSMRAGEGEALSPRSRPSPSSVALVMSLANCSPFSMMAASTPPLLSDSIAVISLVRWLTALAISSALPTKLRATSSLTPVSVRSASLALVRIASVVESASCAERAFGFRRIDLDRLAELLHARIERVGGGLGAGLDLVGDGLGAADQQFLEAADAAVERVGDLERARAQRLVDARRSWRRSRRRLRCRAR